MGERCCAPRSARDARELPILQAYFDGACPIAAARRRRLRAGLDRSRRRPRRAPRRDGGPPRAGLSGERGAGLPPRRARLARRRRRASATSTRCSTPSGSTCSATPRRSCRPGPRPRACRSACRWWAGPSTRCGCSRWPRRSSAAAAASRRRRTGAMSEPPSALHRQLSRQDLVVYGLLFIGPLAPVGVFGVLDARANGAAALVYLVATVAMAFTAWSYAEMSRVVPHAGSVFAYATAGLGAAAGFFAGWLAHARLPADPGRGLSVLGHRAARAGSRGAGLGLHRGRLRGDDRPQPGRRGDCGARRAGGARRRTGCPGGLPGGGHDRRSPSTGRRGPGRLRWWASPPSTAPR